MAKTVLVTGCSGFLGSHIAQWVARAGHRLIACVTKPEPQRWRHAHTVLSLRLPDNRIERLVADSKPDVIVHSAGASRVADSFRDPEADRVSSVLATQCLYDAVAKHSPLTKIIFLSSAAVYGQPETLPIGETTATLPLSPYGEHKLACEQLATQYGTSFGLQIANLRIFSAYGPGLAKQVLWDIYQKSTTGKTILLQGDGTETRDFIYVDDVVNIIAKLITTPERIRDFPVVNIASGASITIRELANLCLRMLGSDCGVEFTGLSLANTPKHWTADVSLLRSLYPTEPYPIELGIAKYNGWLRSHEKDMNASRIVAAAG